MPLSRRFNESRVPSSLPLLAPCLRFLSAAEKLLSLSLSSRLAFEAFPVFRFPRRREREGEEERDSRRNLPTQSPGEENSRRGNRLQKGTGVVQWIILPFDLQIELALSANGTYWEARNSYRDAYGRIIRPFNESKRIIFSLYEYVEGERFTLCLLLALRFVFWKYLLRRLSRATFLFSFYIDPENEIKIDPPFFELRGGCSNCKNLLQSLRYNAFSNVVLFSSREPEEFFRLRNGASGRGERNTKQAIMPIISLNSHFPGKLQRHHQRRFWVSPIVTPPPCPTYLRPEKSLCSPRASPGPRINSLMTCNIATWKI